AWPIYLTIGNLPGRIRNSPTKYAQLLIALLPVSPKLTGNSSAQERQRAWNSVSLYTVLHAILRPLIGLRTVAGSGLRTNCADGHIRECWPILAAWLADHAEHCNLQNIKNNACPRCEIETDDLGSLVENPSSGYRRQQEQYSVKLDEYERLRNLRQKTPESRRLITEIENWLDEKGLKPQRNLFWQLPLVNAGDLHKPDMLHVFDAVWKEMPPYPGFMRPTKAYSEVSQWQGKEMRNFVHIVLPALASALHNPPPAQRFKFQDALRCVGALVRWALMADYPSHNEETLDYLKQYL
ncbi:hypothetical protein Q9L58_010801, partial [Maublancomyces gigas]